MRGTRGQDTAGGNQVGTLHKHVAELKSQTATLAQELARTRRQRDVAEEAAEVERRQRTEYEADAKSLARALEELRAYHHGKAMSGGGDGMSLIDMSNVSGPPIRSAPPAHQLNVHFRDEESRSSAEALQAALARVAATRRADVGAAEHHRRRHYQ